MNYRLIAVLGLLWAASLAAQSGGTFRLTWSSINCGGSRASGAGLALTTTVGQSGVTPTAALKGSHSTSPTCRSYGRER